MTGFGRDAFVALGDRMKSYEHDWRTALPENTWAVIRLDGRSFSAWTRGLQRPYDTGMLDTMGQALTYLCETTPGVQLGFCQSDELSLLITDTDSDKTQMFFGGEIMKLCSITAGTLSAYWARQYPDRPLACFDSRVFAVPSRDEAVACVQWRAQDCVRNAVSMLASHHFSARQLHGVPVGERVRMLAEIGVHLEAADPRFVHGQIAHRAWETGQVEYVHRRTGETMLSPEVRRRRWHLTVAPPITGPFTDTVTDLLETDQP